MDLEQLKRIAHKEMEFFGVRPKVMRTYNEDESEWVDVAGFADLPEKGLTTYATIGMSKYDTKFATKDDKPIRVELIGIMDSTIPDFMNMLGSCACNISSGVYRLHPGVIYPDIVKQYVPKATTAHMLITTPGSWDKPIGDIEMDHAVVTWLQAIPVTEAEFQKARKDGDSDKLVELLVRSKADIWDLNRPSVV